MGITIDDKKGITLIALIITIIVMLILAAVTINIAVNGGLFGYAGKATSDTVKAKEMEQIEMAYAAAFMRNPGEAVDPGDLQEELDEILGENKAEVSGKKVFFIDTQNEYIISADGKVTEHKSVPYTDVFVVVCDNGDLVFSNNEEAINTYILQKGTSEASGYEITNIKDDYYREWYHDSSSDQWLGGYPSWEGDSNITKAVFLNNVVPKETSYLFDSLSNLESIEGIQFLDTSRTTDMCGMFVNCNSLEELDVSGFNTENVTNMAYMFQNCYEIEELDLSNFNTENVTDMSGMFDTCISLSNIDVSSFDTRNVTNMRSMFSTYEDYSASLEELDLSNFNTENVTDMGSMFASTSSLRSIDVSNFDTKKVTSMDHMFHGLGLLEELDLSSFDTRNVEYTSYMFSWSLSLETIYASDSFVMSKVISSYNMFDGCYSIRGGNGFTYISGSSNTAGKYAKINTPTVDGYFTAKPAANP